MATKTTIEMAREAAGDDWGLFQEYMPEIHRLAELVRADERARMATKQTEEIKLALEALEYIEHNYMSLPAPAEKAITALREALAEQPAQQCRTDGRCQYAIDSGAEGMGHCPKGKCVMPAQQEKDWGAVGEAHIAAIKKSSKAMVEDAVVRAAHKVMAEFEAKLDERLMEPPAQQEQNRQIDQLIQERDHRDEIIDKLCDAVLGPDRYEWSSQYFFEDAVREVEERMAEQPAQRKPLTDEEILSIARDHYNPNQRPEISFARAIEAKLKERNT